ncbi:MAG: flagellar biosynthetic protein FliO [Mariprofundales bacterium]|nr:flagellar biosynthetic protein FliO [Mariprofundales bacterium]
MTELMIKSITGLALVLALFAVLVWILRWAQQRTGIKGGSTIRIRRRAILDGKHSLIEVEYDGELLLLGISPNGISKLKQSSADSAP